MRAVLVVLASLLVAAPAKAQCLGDFNSSGAVEINELVTAVNNALSGCGGDPTPTPSGNACPYRFTDRRNGMGPFCAYLGPFNTECGIDLTCSWATNGDLLVALCNTQPFAAFGAMVTGAGAAALTDFSLDSFQTSDPVGGTISVDSSGRLAISPTFPPLTVGGCNFVAYLGEYTGTIGTGAASTQTLGPWPMMEEAFVRLRALRDAQRLTPPPDFERAR